ncbi:MAG: hypothetical protein KDA27_19805 [Candidatus Eisenbacteria bacterium]|uniref:Uncharacterized protein n=1 Tax=Eiseniibacteriota bacterium TaxID=2212470 RepID=A0A956SH42_UNCEI|nr:hypothetical protein [Candidatus Eisenbacteria bacterium]
MESRSEYRPDHRPETQGVPSTAQTRAHLSKSFYATKPTGGTTFFRTFLPYQIWRFIWINLKMIRIIGKSHK